MHKPEFVRLMDFVRVIQPQSCLGLLGGHHGSPHVSEGIGLFASICTARFAPKYSVQLKLTAEELADKTKSDE